MGSPATPFVAEFVGADRGLKRLSVTGIELSDLERPPLVGPNDTLAEAHACQDVAVIVDGVWRPGLRGERQRGGKEDNG